MCLPLAPARVERRLLRTQQRRESDWRLLKFMYLGRIMHGYQITNLCGDGHGDGGLRC